MSSLKLQLARFITNDVIARIPSYTVRHAWYRRVLGMAIGNRTAIQMGQYVHFSGRTGRDGREGISIGHNTIVSRGCCLDGRGGLRIGSNVSISPWVTILTDAHDIRDPMFPEVFMPVEIGDHSWLSTRAMILPGVTIGEGAVVAAGAVVTKDVEPYTVVAGSPARCIGQRPDDLRYELDYMPLFE